MTPVLLACMVVSVLLYCLWLRKFRNQLFRSPVIIIGLAVLHTVAGVFFAVLFAGLEQCTLSFSDGMRIYGVIFLIPLLCVVETKILHCDSRTLFDVMTLCMISSLIPVRINCIVTGCCVGKLLPGSDVLRWPTREAEMLFHSILLVLFYRKLRRGDQPGTLYPLYMIQYGIFRFITEWLREGDIIFCWMHPAHVWSILSIAVGCGFYFEITARERRRAQRVRIRR